MGVPAFFKWLMMRYPKVVIDAMQKIDSGYDINEFLRSKYDDESSMPEMDNLYLDMNGIIHPCCHPQDRVKKILNRNLNNIEYNLHYSLSKLNLKKINIFF